jgi:hypothetical protein
MQRRKNPHAVALGRLGGSASTPKQAEASRRNGRLGGRPKTVEASKASPDDEMIYEQARKHVS